MEGGGRTSEQGGRTSEQEEQDDGAEFRLMNPQARRTSYNSPLSSTNEGSSIFYGGLATDQTSVTNGKQSYESNIGHGHKVRGPRAEQAWPNLPGEEAFALALEGLGFKDGGVVAEASNPYACDQTSPMNNAQPPFAVDTLGMQGRPRGKPELILDFPLLRTTLQLERDRQKVRVEGDPPESTHSKGQRATKISSGSDNPTSRAVPVRMTTPQLRNEITVGGERNGRRTEALLSVLSDQRCGFPVYHGASPMNPETHTHRSLLTSIASRRSPYQHQPPLPNVADSLRASSPYQQQFFADVQAPSFMSSGYQQQLPNNGSGLLQPGNSMNSAVSPLSGYLTQPFYGYPSDNALSKRYSQSDLSTMGGNPCQRHPWCSCCRKAESFEFPHLTKAYSANDLLDYQAVNKFKNHRLLEEVSTSSHGMDPLIHRNQCNNYGRASFNRKRNPCMSDVTIDSKFDSVDSVKGEIYSLAKDQRGCNFLQSKLYKGSPEDIGKIYDEIIDHILELMTDPFGNNLVQKFLEICDEKQRLHILHAITREEGVLIRVSCNKHGTHVVQKVIEALETPVQISMFVNSLKHPVIVTLMKDVNGNHVAQHCLKFFPPEFKELLYRAAIAHCAELAVDRQGCCVLQKCISHSEGVWKERILLEICSNSRFLSSDAYGNYAVQYVLEQNIPWATNIVLGQLEGSYEELSTEKHGSNVVENCLRRASEEQLEKIVNILMHSLHFLQIMVNPYGNYVIQSALKQCKGSLYSALVGAIRSHGRVLRCSQYGKKVLASIR